MNSSTQIVRKGCQRIVVSSNILFVILDRFECMKGPLSDTSRPSLKIAKSKSLLPKVHLQLFRALFGISARIGMQREKFLGAKFTNVPYLRSSFCFGFESIIFILTQEIYFPLHRGNTNLSNKRTKVHDKEARMSPWGTLGS